MSDYNLITYQGRSIINLDKLFYVEEEVCDNDEHHIIFFFNNSQKVTWKFENYKQKEGCYDWLIKNYVRDGIEY